MAYVEGEGEIRYLDDKKALAAYEAGWARLSNAALRFEETRLFLSQIAKDFRGLTSHPHAQPAATRRPLTMTSSERPHFAEDEFRRATASNPNQDHRAGDPLVPRRRPRARVRPRQVRAIDNGGVIREVNHSDR